MYPCSFLKTGPDSALSPHPPALKSVAPDATPQVPHLSSRKAVMALGHIPTHTLSALQAGGTGSAGLRCKQRGAVLASKFSSDPLWPTWGCRDGEEPQRARSLQRRSCLLRLLMGCRAAPYCIWDPIHPTQSLLCGILTMLLWLCCSPLGLAGDSRRRIETTSAPSPACLGDGESPIRSH